MFKGFLLLLMVGAAFAYFVFNFVGDVEKEDPASYVSENEKKAQEWAKYYTKDALGEPVLSFGTTPVKTADEVWQESQLRQEMLENFPDFQGIRQFVNGRLEPSLFRKYLLKKIDDIESDYMGGRIDSEEAKNRLSDL